MMIAGWVVFGVAGAAPLVGSAILFGLASRKSGGSLASRKSGGSLASLEEVLGGLLFGLIGLSGASPRSSTVAPEVWQWG